MPTIAETARPDHPLEIARAAFRLLVLRRVVPTPEAYRLAYDEVAGVDARANAESILADFGSSLDGAPAPVAAVGARIQDAVARRDWSQCGSQLAELQAVLVQPAQLPVPEPDEARAARQLVPTAAERQADLLRNLLGRTLSLAVASLLQGVPKLADEADALGRLIRDSTSRASLETATARLRQLCFDIELHTGDHAERQELLLRLFRLLLDNIGELIDDDDWMRSQVAAVHTLLSGPITHRVLDDAAQNLKEIIYRQGVLRQGILDARATVRRTMMDFIDQLGTIVSSRSEFAERMDHYTEQISNAADIGALNDVLGRLVQLTRATQADASRAHDELLRTRQELQEAESRVHAIEGALSQMSERVHEDALTGGLNRRGLEDMLAREVARADRRGLPLCLAMLVLDELPPSALAAQPGINDMALVHFTHVAGEALRTMDIVGRLDGPAFMIVLPDTGIDNASMVLTRLQRSLAERPFPAEGDSLPVTFCAGVVLRATGEDQSATIARAGRALHLARLSGKSRLAIGDA